MNFMNNKENIENKTHFPHSLYFNIHLIAIFHPTYIHEMASNQKSVEPTTIAPPPTFGLMGGRALKGALKGCCHIV